MENRDTSLSRFWNDEGRQPKMGLILTMPTYHEHLWNDKVDAENKTNEIATKPTYHKLLWTDETDADNKTGVCT